MDLLDYSYVTEVLDATRWRVRVADKELKVRAEAAERVYNQRAAGTLESDDPHKSVTTEVKEVTEAAVRLTALQQRVTYLEDIRDAVVTPSVGVSALKVLVDRLEQFDNEYDFGVHPGVLR